MNKVDIRHVIKNIAEGYIFKFSDDKFDLDGDLREQYMIDDLDIAGIFEEFQTEIGIDLEIEDIYFNTGDFEDVKTLNDIITIIHNKITK